MPLTNLNLMPPESNFRKVLTAIGDELTPIVEEVRYSLRLPDDETADLVAYIEFESPLTVINESIESSQRSWMPLKVLVYLLINESDSRILADLLEHVSKTLFAQPAVQRFYNAFGTWDGFSIEQFSVTEVGFGEDFCQAKITLEVLFHNSD